MTYKTPLAAALTALALSFAAPVVAQDAAADATAVKPTEIAPADVTDEQVADFVTVLLAVEDIRNEYAPKMKAATDDETRQELAAEANAAALQAVESVEGLSAEEYLGIGKAASQDKDLTARITAQMQDATAE